MFCYFSRCNIDNWRERTHKRRMRAARTEDGNVLDSVGPVPSSLMQMSGLDWPRGWFKERYSELLSASV